MNHVLDLFKFAWKEQLEYKWNLIFGIFFMVVNDILFLSIFLVFLNYFQGVSLNMGDFLLIWSFAATLYGAVFGLFANVSILSEIIESGKLDYYLSLPMNLLKIISLTKINPYGVGDVVFGFIAILIYFTFYSHMNYLILLKRVVLIILCSMFIVGLFLITSAISFFMDRGSVIGGFIQELNVNFATWPPQIYQNKKIVYFIVGLLGLYPSIFLPYSLMRGNDSLFNRLAVIFLNVGVFLLGIYCFNKGIQKYTSGNLVNQM